MKLNIKTFYITKKLASSYSYYNIVNDISYNILRVLVILNRYSDLLKSKHHHSKYVWEIHKNNYLKYHKYLIDLLALDLESM